MENSSRLPAVYRSIVVDETKKKTWKLTRTDNQWVFFLHNVFGIEKQAAASDDGLSVRSINCIARNNTSLFHSETFAGANRCVHSYWMVPHHRSKRTARKSPIDSIIIAVIVIIYLFSGCYAHSRTIWPTFLFHFRCTCALCSNARRSAWCLPTQRWWWYIARQFVSYLFESKHFPTRVKCCMDEHVPVGSRPRRTTTISYVYYLSAELWYATFHFVHNWSERTTIVKFC